MDPAGESTLSTRVQQRLQSRTCGWCGSLIPYSGRGRPPTYCSKAHRNRAWEVRTAEARLQRDIATAAATAEPVREVITETVTHTQTRVQTRLDRRPPATARGWVEHLNELTRQLDDDQLGREHWNHARLYRALADAVNALDRAHPGGLDRLLGR
ncbi:hypothetical protein MTP10_40850 [Nonomuraea sp. 3-1Str]|uniref:hypothetical protein n=1 Tax=Nonomuraea sp. 3-1Str TaxID=2929801 RepID=UPI002866883E|nr:hypothetical protein [Nonomuraea sp. 3-1Str]MDR8415067.1 hypothetical protein [Nonomuraea sp. 3-1Str]